MPTYGQRPQDVVTDNRGNALSGIAVEVYSTEALATAGESPDDTLTTDARGRWTYVSSGDVWARLPDGEVWEVYTAASAATDHGTLAGLGDDDHTQYALADGTRGTFAAPLGVDDNYVTDAEKVKLANLSGTNTGDQTLPTWSTISGKPAVVAEGATQADARTAIGLGTAATTASTAYATAAQGALADTALQPATAQTINAQTGTTYTLVAADAGKLVTLTNAAAITLTVPASVFSAGQRIDCVVMGAGMVTVTASGTTVNGTPSLVSRAQYSAFTVVCTAANTFVVIGDLA